MKTKTQLKKAKKVKRPSERVPIGAMRKILNDSRDSNGKIRWSLLKKVVLALKTLPLADKMRFAPLLGYENRLQPCIDEGIFDAFRYRPGANKKPLIQFKKYGQDLPAIVFWDGKPQPEEWNKKFPSHTPEILISSLIIPEVKLPKEVSSALIDLGVMEDKRGGYSVKWDFVLQEEIVNIVWHWLEKHDDIPSAAKVKEELPQEYQSKYFEDSTINRYLDRAIYKAIGRFLALNVPA
ncbi:MAG: hypothetical protein A2Z83_07535 [Omnitrophica bacterium GWA2_52_8]|nr:MAG: hypothetical protein A2Z83_07535 [Omnitrophica bacterium GWA2_52_8]